MARGNASERLHVNVGFSCNNNCVFCMEEDRKRRETRRERISPGVIRDLLRRRKSRQRVMFTSGEPTLNPVLPDLISIAKAEGYRTIGLTTNGRMLSYEPYTIELLMRGLNFVVFSIHGASAKEHDSLSRAPGSFEQSMAGLSAACRLKSRFGLSIVTSTVVNRRNIGSMAAIFRRFGPLPVDRIVFNFIRPDGRAEKLFATLVPRFSEAARAFESLLREEPGAASRCCLADMPPCTTLRLPRETRGYVEHYRYFETQDTNASGRGRGRIEESGRRELGVLTVKRPDCGGCAAGSRCDGVWRIYAERYGWEEFVPILKRK